MHKLIGYPSVREQTAQSNIELFKSLRPWVETLLEPEELAAKPRPCRRPQYDWRVVVARAQVGGRP